MSNTLESKRQTILVQANTVSPSFHHDVLALLEEKSVDKAGLDTISGYLKAVALVSNMNSYKMMKEEASREQHCVRCHDEFTEEYNDPDSCVIPHVFDGDDYQRWGGGLRYTSKCCGEGATVLEETPGNCDYEDLDRLGKCFKGRHTTSVKAVRYNDINIVRCKLEGGECATEYIGDDDDEPVFNY
jgi:hypothetical protein